MAFVIRPFHRIRLDKWPVNDCERQEAKESVMRYKMQSQNTHAERHIAK